MRFRFAQYVGAPADTIAAFYADARNLLVISPRFPRLRILSEQSTIQQERTITLELDFLLFRVRWNSFIERFVPGEYFTDTFSGKVIRRWRHIHRFAACLPAGRPKGDGTLLTDEITAEATWWAAPFLWLGVRLLFLYRHRAMRRLFG